MCACVLASHFTGRAPCFDLQCCSLRFFSLFFHTSPALSHFRLPPSSHMQRAHRLPQHQCRHGNLERGSSCSGYRRRSLGPSFVLFCEVEGLGGRSANVSVAPERTNAGCISQGCTFQFISDLCSPRVRAYNSNEQMQECRTGCGKKIPGRVYVKNKP